MEWGFNSTRQIGNTVFRWVVSGDAKSGKSEPEGENQSQGTVMVLLLPFSRPRRPSLRLGQRGTCALGCDRPGRDWQGDTMMMFRSLPRQTRTYTR